MQRLCQLIKAQVSDRVKRSERRSGNTDGGPAKQAKKRSLRAVNEHSEPVFNAAWPSAVVFTQSGLAGFRAHRERPQFLRVHLFKAVSADLVRCWPVSG
jgi:hypothetical protein